MTSRDPKGQSRAYLPVTGRRSLAVAGKQTSSVNDVIHYECVVDISVYSLYIELSRYGKFPEFLRKNSGKFPTFYFFRKSYNPIRMYRFVAKF